MTTSCEENRNLNLKFCEPFGYVLCGLSWCITAFAFFMLDFRTVETLSLAILLLICGMASSIGSIYTQDRVKK